MSKYKLTKQQIESFWNSKSKITYFENQTNREWAKDALLTLLIEGEGFSGKRPNCGSGWEYELLISIIQAVPEIGKVIINEYNEEEPELNDNIVLADIYKQLIKGL
jgi:hypothetical protein